MKFAKRFPIFAIASLFCGALIYTFWWTPKHPGPSGLRSSEAVSRPVRQPGSPATILLWTTFFGQSNFIPSLDTLGCPEPNCLITSNRSLFRHSDAVLFHLRDTSPDDLPNVRFPWQKWILLHHESPPHTPNILESLDGLINWTATYREDSEINLSPKLVHRPHPLPPGHPALNKTRMAVWFVSNCHTPSLREDFVRELRKTVSVDVFGACGQKSCLPKMSEECLRKVSGEYRFYLSFENSICKDYVTEKFFNILNTDMVPVVLGGASYSRIAPPDSFIDALSFKSPRELGRHLIRVAKDSRLYESYFRWRKRYTMDNQHYVCQICQKLHRPDSGPSIYSNLNRWWFGDADCRSWNL